MIINDIVIMFYYRLIKFICCFFLSAFIIGCVFLILLLIYRPASNLVLITCMFTVVMLIDFLILKLFIDDIKRNIRRLEKQKKGKKFYERFITSKNYSNLN